MKVQLLSAVLLCGILSAQNIAKGYVFEDKNNNGIKDTGESEFPILLYPMVFRLY